jgi:glycosyltransferase involved in cell wall biosynthesis
MVDPLVSVIIPTYDSADYIAESLASVVSQTFTGYDIILVNDGSRDTPRLEASIAPWRSRITYIHQHNRGAAAARNAALRLSRGTWVAFLDADDVWAPTYLEKQLAFLRAHPHADLVYADGLLIGDSPTAGRTFMELAPSRGEVTVDSLLALRCHVITSAVVARRQSIIDAGLFDETLRRGHDFDLWVRLARRGANLSYQRKVLISHRIRPDSLTGDEVSDCERAVETFRHVAKTLDLTDVERASAAGSIDRITARLHVERSKQCLDRGDIPGAIEAIGRANQIDWRLKQWLILVAIRLWPSLMLRVRRASWNMSTSRRRVSSAPRGTAMVLRDY